MAEPKEGMIAAETPTTCPFCGGHVVRVEITDSGGERAFSLCCDMPLEFIDNYDVYAALPDLLQEVALARKREEWDAMVAKARTDAQLFKAECERWNATHGWLFKGEGGRHGDKGSQAQKIGPPGRHTPGPAGG